MNKMIKLDRSQCALVLLPWVAACATFAPMLEPDARLDPAAGYIYGRFSLEVSLSGYPDPLGMGLLIQEPFKSESLTIGFIVTDEPSDISVLAVKPGTYALRKIVYYGGGEYGGGKPEPTALPSSASLSFRVEPGKAYYIGDYYGRSVAHPVGNGFWITWELVAAIFNYRDATSDLKRDFRALEGVETVQAIQGDLPPQKYPLK